MILVDSSVWIAVLRNQPVAMARLEASRDEDLAIGDVVLLEVLQGARTEADAARIERNLRQFPVLPMLGPSLAARAARNYRLLRARGVTMRKSADLIIGTFCIEHGHRLMHGDRDFDPMATHLGLRIA